MNQKKRKRIGVDLLVLSQLRDTGMVTYTAAILPYLFQQMSNYDFVLFCKNGVPLPFDVKTHANVRVICTHWMRSSWLWKLVGISAKAVIERLDLLFIPVSRVPVMKTCKVAAFLHDVGFLSMPEYLARRTLRPTRTAIRLMAGSADLILTNSCFTRDEFCKFYNVPLARIAVTYLGYESHLFNDVPPQKTEVARVLKRYGIMTPYVLYLGVIQGRKNLKHLIDACAVWTRTRPELKLVLAGARGWNCEEIYAAAASLPELVLMPGRIATEDLPVLYKMAECYVLPSFYEGFGMPVIESMACGTPNLLSSRGALPEVGSDAAVYFDPSDPEAISRVILRVLEDPSQIAVMRAAGLLRCRVFLWETVCERTASALMRVME